MTNESGGFDHTVTVRISPELYRSAMCRWLQRHWRQPHYLVGYLVLAAGLTVLFALTGRGLNARLATALVVAVVAVLLLRPLFTNRQRTRFYRAVPDERVTYRVSDDVFEVRTALTEGKMAWNLLGKVWRFPDVWLLFVARQRFFILPVDQIEPAVLDFIHLKTQKAAGKDYFHCAQCSYSLLGDTADSCPECGTPIPYEDIGLSRERFHQLCRQMRREAVPIGEQGKPD